MWSRSCLLSHEPYKQHLLVRESPPQEGASTVQSAQITYSRLKSDASTVSIVSLAIILKYPFEPQPQNETHRASSPRTPYYSA